MFYFGVQHGKMFVAIKYDAVFKLSGRIFIKRTTCDKLLKSKGHCNAVTYCHRVSLTRLLIS